MLVFWNLNITSDLNFQIDWDRAQILRVEFSLSLFMNFIRNFDVDVGLINRLMKTSEESIIPIYLFYFIFWDYMVLEVNSKTRIYELYEKFLMLMLV